MGEEVREGGQRERESLRKRKIQKEQRGDERGTAKRQSDANRYGVIMEDKACLRDASRSHYANL